jgi:anti-anti-sigma factor
MVVMTTAGHPLVSVDASFEAEALVVRLRGELDLACRVVVEPAIDAALETSARVVLALGNATFCGSTGIEMLLIAHANAATHGTELTVRNVLPNVRRLLWLTGIDQVLTITTP